MNLARQCQEPRGGGLPQVPRSSSHRLSLQGGYFPNTHPVFPTVQAAPDQEKSLARQCRGPEGWRYCHKTLKALCGMTSARQEKG